MAGKVPKNHQKELELDSKGEEQQMHGKGEQVGPKLMVSSRQDRRGLKHAKQCTV